MRSHVSWGFNCKTSKSFHQRTRLSSQSKQGSNWQHQLKEASLYSRHIMTSALQCLINSHILLKYFKLVFFQLQLTKISCNHHLSELWKKEKSVLLWNTVYSVTHHGLTRSYFSPLSSYVTALTYFCSHGTASTSTVTDRGSIRCHISFSWTALCFGRHTLAHGWDRCSCL